MSARPSKAKRKRIKAARQAQSIINATRQAQPTLTPLRGLRSSHDKFDAASLGWKHDPIGWNCKDAGTGSR